jgi:hypothetical protein
MGCARTHPEPLWSASCPHCVQLHDGGAFTSSAPLSGHPARLASKSVVAAPATFPKASFIGRRLHQRMAARPPACAIGSCPLQCAGAVSSGAPESVSRTSLKRRRSSLAVAVCPLSMARSRSERARVIHLRASSRTSTSSSIARNDKQSRGLSRREPQDRSPYARCAAHRSLGAVAQGHRQGRGGGAVR